MEYEVRKVRDRDGLRDFLRLPFTIYRGNPHWVPPLDAEVRRVLDPGRNPYFRQATLDLFLCYREGVPVARTILVINKEHCRTFHVHTAFFGFYEALENLRGSLLLFEAVDEQCRERGIDFLEGPFNPNHYSELGLLADHYDEDQSFFQTYNPPYYHAQLTAAGFAPCRTLFTARNPDVRSFLQPESRVPEPATSVGQYVARPFSMTGMRHDLEKVREVFNDAFSANWNFLPATREEHFFSSKYLKMVTDPTLVTIVEHNGNPAGVLLCVLDVNPLLRQMHGRRRLLSYLRFVRGRKALRTLVVYAVGIKKGYQRTRVYAMLLESMRRMASRFDVLESTWMSPANPPAVAAAERMGMKEHKHFLIYGKSVPTKDGKRNQAGDHDNVLTQSGRPGDTRGDGDR